jgi:L-threonylcarbamoyladenylate synthase
MQKALLYSRDDWQTVAEKLRLGSVGVLPTDTLYGLVASIHQAEAVERVYSLKHRDVSKPCIILISDLTDLQLFAVATEKYVSHFQQYWPGPVSLVMSVGVCHEHICRGGSDVAFRLPADLWLRQLLKKSGPLIAPSANPEGEPPAMTIIEAQKYFNDAVDFYVDGGVLSSTPSRLISLVGDEIQNLR